jgi:FixJ family two-component response regulator
MTYQEVIVAIIDDEIAIRRSLKRLLVSAGLTVLAFESAAEFLASPECEQASCVVSDLRMPGLNGLQLQEALHKRCPHLSVVLITGYGDVRATATAMKAGAIDFLEKPIKGTELIQAVQNAIEHSQELKTLNAQITQLKASYASLTPREREVFAFVTVGLLNKQVGAALGASERTIKQHRGQVMSKMKADSLADLVLMAERLGIKPPAFDLLKVRGRIPST